MARMYKTQDILRKKRRKNYYVDENGNILYEKRNIAGYLDSIETRLDKVIETMIEQNADWSMPQIMRKANVEGVSKKQYSETYRDVIDMIKKYQMGITEKDDDEKDIPNFDTLPDAVRKKELHHVYKTEDSFVTYIYLMMGIVSDELLKKADYTFQFGNDYAADNNMIHDDFVGRDINDLFSLIEEKYNNNLRLLEEYHQIKSNIQK